ncbi:MAG: bifunctional 4-hydroxy-2-oxoglutarate aldolase/2-dehydro-3-deoxy-phosphogluconate aldolase [Oscillospiraceae bacterium]|nr:bifunctional 4-hydroxy-2-oxoglutarate aldolase/2-dehydro-3-deoxy-phosphogluconate aldolase [Oscillospiraceae bacterium]
MKNAADMIFSTGILPVLNVKHMENVDPLAQILRKTGIRSIELLFRNENAAKILSAMKTRHPELAVGAGTIMTIPQAQAAIDAGADYIVCPGYDQRLVDWCCKREILIVPGCPNASDLQLAYASGLRVAKFFPAEQLGGLGAVKLLSGAFSGMKFIVTGGISMDSLSSYLRSPVIAACGGSFLAPAADLDSGNYEHIEALCTQAVELSMGFSVAHVGINAPDEAGALDTAQRLSDLFAVAPAMKNRSVFAGTLAECMKGTGRGVHGHIAIRTNSVERAVAFLRERGATFDMDTAGYDGSGRLKFVYLNQEIGGFALHLTL